jgi:hypothetical protein
MKIKALQTIIEWDGTAMVIINAGEEGELADALAQGHVDGGTAEPAGKTKPAAKAKADDAPAAPATDTDEAPAG